METKNRLLNSDIDFVNESIPYSRSDFNNMLTKLSSNDYYQLMVNTYIGTYGSAKFFGESTKTLPENFNWKTITEFDPPSIVSKKKLISEPENQYLCGNCWAMSTVQTIGDRFVVAGLVNWVPDLSTTFAMLYYPQGQCDGGNSAKLMRQIHTGIGLASKHCIDYSWCSRNIECKTDNSFGHFVSEDKSYLLPSKKGCYYNSKHYIYKIDSRPKIISGYGTLNTDNEVLNNQILLKQEILANGPAVGGFLVFENFTSAFTKVNGGVYLENVSNYGSGKPVEFNPHINKYSGNHVVSILGWGVAKGIKISNTQFADVPYWFCRNTWGKNWGDKGYFKIAMYPFNKKSQFLKLVSIVDHEGHTRRNSGVVICNVSETPILQSLPVIPSTEIPKSLNRSTAFYSQDENHEIKNQNAKNTNAENTHIIFILFLSITILFIFIIL